MENNVFVMPNGNYVMTSATSITTGETRTDKGFPQWIGMTMQFMPIEYEHGARFCYVKDNRGNPKFGAMRTSSVVWVAISKDEIFVTIKTINTIYLFEKVEEG